MDFPNNATGMFGSPEEVVMAEKLEIDKWLQEEYRENGIHEFPFFSIGRQGGRTAVEILARALIMEGKHVYLGQNLTGKRSMGTNNIVARFADTPDIPATISILQPNGVMFMHEALVWPDFGGSYAQLKRADVVQKFQSGILMVCTAKAPEEVEYPIDFAGTVATVDAEAIFAEKVGIQPAPSGITSLGLFVAATKSLVSLEAVKKATLDHDRLSKRVRELNVECMQRAFETARVAENIRLKGKVSLAEYAEIADRKPASDLITPEEKSVSTLWREQLPSCDVRKCVCIECLAAYYCPEGVIRWKDEAYEVDYTLCKGCGTCALECPEKAIVMEEAETVLAKQAKTRKRRR
jgi:pyruvate ferredoxin oxidoreductase delta subunit